MDDARVDTVVTAIQKPPAPAKSATARSSSALWSPLCGSAPRQGQQRHLISPPRSAREPPNALPSGGHSGFSLAYPRLQRAARAGTRDSPPVGDGEATTPQLRQPSASAAVITPAMASAWAKGSRTTPPLPTRSFPTSNWGFTKRTSRRSLCNKRPKAGSTNAKRMKDIRHG